MAPEDRAVDLEADASCHRGSVPMGAQETLTLAGGSQRSARFNYVVLIL